MIRRLCVITVFLLAALAAGCSNTNSNANETANANAANTNTTTEATSTKPAPDNSEITTNVDANGVKTETRVFRDNPRVSKVVVTTRNGTRTAKAYSPSGEERELNKNEPEDWMETTGSKTADAAGFVADKTKDAAGTVKDKTVDSAKTVGSKTAEGAKVVGEKTAAGAKTVGEKTAEGAKKTGKALKKVFTP